MQLKYRSFVGDIGISKSQIPQIEIVSPQSQEPQKIKHILIGSHKSVTTTMQVLQQLGYANTKDWSPLLPTENPGEVMSVLVRELD
ncbi:hypothetical protein [Calothrix sp. 336/3]|uniref:hypothetical protein n=1 Tax=Calothrix sp. 336/3 TaxID=1337936 RepID=UPI0004E38ED3|nr:hypothetical protein [Calothrix sp. 336/3]AKG21316.1 hypothetical protein IJ00_08390 [Calothrix sp. 336/3]